MCKKCAVNVQMHQKLFQIQFQMILYAKYMKLMIFCSFTTKLFFLCNLWQANPINVKTNDVVCSLRKKATCPYVLDVYKTRSMILKAIVLFHSHGKSYKVKTIVSVYVLKASFSVHCSTIVQCLNAFFLKKLTHT